MALLRRAERLVVMPVSLLLAWSWGNSRDLVRAIAATGFCDFIQTDLVLGMKPFLVDTMEPPSSLPLHWRVVAPVFWLGDR